MVSILKESKEFIKENLGSTKGVDNEKVSDKCYDDEFNKCCDEEIENLNSNEINSDIKDKRIIKAKEEKIENNIKNIALIFEGGGMRGAFSAGVTNALMDLGLYFDYVAGISAGCSQLVNYLSRDRERTRKSFIDIVDDKNIYGWKHFFKGEGFFNSEYIYEKIGKKGEWLEFDFDTFFKNPAKYRVVAFDATNNCAKNFSNEDVRSEDDIMKICKASSSLPVFMPPTVYNDVVYYDGGLTGGIPIEIAEKDGFDKFFIVRTQERGYRKSEVRYPRFYRKHFKNEPCVAEAIINRPAIYNAECDYIEKLEKEGRAYVVYPDSMNIINRETNKQKLIDLYNQGYEIGMRDSEKWKAFINK